MSARVTAAASALRLAAGGELGAGEVELHLDAGGRGRGGSGRGTGAGLGGEDRVEAGASERTASTRAALGSSPGLKHRGLSASKLRARLQAEIDRGCSARPRPRWRRGARRGRRAPARARRRWPSASRGRRRAPRAWCGAGGLGLLLGEVGGQAGDRGVVAVRGRRRAGGRRGGRRRWRCRRPGHGRTARPDLAGGTGRSDRIAIVPASKQRRAAANIGPLPRACLLRPVCLLFLLAESIEASNSLAATVLVAAAACAVPKMQQSRAVRGRKPAERRRREAIDSAAASGAIARPAFSGDHERAATGPHAGAGQRIGLLGGSFDPPHAGHVHITRWALKAFGLDRVWWLVSPGNPLKPDAPADLDRRLAAARAIMRHPRVDGDRPRGAARHALHRGDAGGAEGALSGGALRLADGGGQPRELPPLGPLARDHGGGAGGRAGAAGRTSSAPGCRRRRGGSRAGGCRVARRGALPFREPPAWTLVSGRMLDLSSSELRALGVWRRCTGGHRAAGAAGRRAAAWLAAPAVRRGGGGARPSRWTAILAGVGARRADRLRAGRPRERRAGRGAARRTRGGRRRRSRRS